MASNLHGDDPAAYVERLRGAFGVDHVLLVDEAKMSNQVAFAWIGEAPAGGGADVDAARAALSGGTAGRELAPVLERVARALRHRRKAACAS